MKYLAIDVGGTYTKVGIVDENMNFIKTYQEKTIKTKNECIEMLNKIIEDNMQEYKIDGIGFSFPGFIDFKKGKVVFGGALTELNGFELKDYFENKHNIKVYAENDVNCVALAENLVGNAINVDNFVCFTIGTGIGGALFLNGKLYRGHDFAAGEFGFIKSHGDYGSTYTGKSLSTTTAIWALRQNFAEHLNLPFEEVTGEMIFMSEDAYAKKLVNSFYDDVANLAATIIYSLNPQKVLIGGGISAKDGLLDEIKKRLNKIAPDINFELDVCKLKNDAGMIGSIYNFIN